MQELVRLNREIPFVQAVWAGSADAFLILSEAEKRHGVQILPLSEDTPFGGFHPHRLDVLPPLPDDLVRRCSDPTFFEQHFYSLDEWIDDPKIRRHQEDLEDRLCAFMTDLHLLIGGSAFTNRHVFLFKEGSVLAPTARMLGEIVVGWASTHYPVAKCWTYAHCALHLPDLVEDYDGWERKICNIMTLQMKCRVLAARDVKRFHQNGELG